MSLFQFGFTVKETVNSQNSAAHSQPANAGACAFLPEQEATNLGSEEYNEVVLSVGDAVDPNKNLSSKRKRGNYNAFTFLSQIFLYYLELCHILKQSLYRYTTSPSRANCVCECVCESFRFDLKRNFLPCRNFLSYVVRT